MANIACLVPKQGMLEQVKEIIDQENMVLHTLKMVATEDAVDEARAAVSDGADIIVARGLQAYVIKNHITVPVVEITLTAQELGRLIQHAKRILGKDHPKIGIVGFENMFCDMSYFNEIFEIDLKTYMIREMSDTGEAVEQAVKDRVDLVIGGDNTVMIAQMNGLQTLFLESTKDSIKEALEVASTVGYARDLERQNHAQVETLLDTSFNGIIKMDSKGAVLASNRIMEDILHRGIDDLMGMYLSQVIPEIEGEYVEEVLSGKRDMYSTFFKIKQTSVMIMLAPIKVDQHITGAVLSCHKVKQMQQTESETLREMYLHGYVAKSNFEQIHRKSREMKHNIEIAKMFARSHNPVLISGETGTEKEMFAQSIHNNSVRRSGPFISINCNGMLEQVQAEVLFGEAASHGDSARQKGALELGNHGTVLIHEIEQLSLHCQYRLFKAIKYKALIQNDIEKTKNLDVRIIATTKKNISVLAGKGLFREDLYYALSGLSLDLPPIRECPSDIEHLVELFVKEYCEMYSRYTKITAGAMKRLKEFSWKGNLIQLESFCERMVLTVTTHSIDEDLVNYLLEQIFPVVREQENSSQIVVYKSPEAAALANLLEKHNGNRAQVAKELNISTTTLWRRIKKYGINNKYNI